MTFRSFTKKTSVTAIFLGAMLVASVALAAWVASGSGSGYATAVEAEDLTTSAATAAATLYPGQQDGDLEITINNPNDYPVNVTSIVRTPSTNITSDQVGCTVANHAVSLEDPVTVDIDILANGSTTTTVPSVVRMGATSDDACQGAVFTIPVDVTGTSNA